MLFTDNFDSFVCMGDTIELDVEGFTITARLEHDEQSHIDDDDCHNVDQSVTGCDDEQYATLLKNRQAWLDGEWVYCGVVLSVSKAGVTLDNHAASLWGIEANYPTGDNKYLRDVANELLSDAVEQGHAIMIKLNA